MGKRALGVATAIVWMVLASASTSSQQATTGLVWDVTNGTIVGASSMAVGAIAQAAPDSVVQWGVVHFDEPTTAAGRRLSGTCLLVHDEYWETSDFPCTTIYEFENGRAGEPLASFSCTRAVHATTVGRFSVFVQPTEPPRPQVAWELVGFSYAGTYDIHRVPRLEVPAEVS